MIKTIIKTPQELKEVTTKTIIKTPQELKEAMLNKGQSEKKIIHQLEKKYVKEQDNITCYGGKLNWGNEKPDVVEKAIVKKVLKDRMWNCNFVVDKKGKVILNLRPKKVRVTPEKFHVSKVSDVKEKKAESLRKSVKMMKVRKQKINKIDNPVEQINENVIENSNVVAPIKKKIQIKKSNTSI
jgi:hypothetical protein